MGNWWTNVLIILLVLAFVGAVYLSRKLWGNVTESERENQQRAEDELKHYGAAAKAMMICEDGLPVLPDQPVTVYSGPYQIVIVQDDQDWILPYSRLHGAEITGGHVKDAEQSGQPETALPVPAKQQLRLRYQSEMGERTLLFALPDDSAVQLGRDITSQFNQQRQFANRKVHEL